MNFGGCPAVESSSDVRSERNASANCDFGCVSTLIFRCAVDQVRCLIHGRPPGSRNDGQRRQLGDAFDLRNAAQPGVQALHQERHYDAAEQAEDQRGNE